MFDPDRRLNPGAAAGGSDVSPELEACLPYIKLLDTALKALPARFHFKGRVQRGVKHAFPSPDHHDPVSYFQVAPADRF